MTVDPLASYEVPNLTLKLPNNPVPCAIPILIVLFEPESGRVHCRCWKPVALNDTGIAAVRILNVPVTGCWARWRL